MPQSVSIFRDASLSAKLHWFLLCILKAARVFSQKPQNCCFGDHKISCWCISELWKANLFQLHAKLFWNPPQDHRGGGALKSQNCGLARQEVVHNSLHAAMKTCARISIRFNWKLLNHKARYRSLHHCCQLWQAKAMNAGLPCLCLSVSLSLSLSLGTPSAFGLQREIRFSARSDTSV